MNDKAYNKLGFNIHNYFFAKALDQVRPGGVVAFVTSRYTMDAKDSTVRRYLAQRAELLGAIRLPNNAFRANAGTDVVSDILFLQKRDRPLDIAPDWTQTGRTEEGFTVNQYFLDHPEMVLGRPTAESTQYGKQDYTVAPIEGLELADQLHDAVKYIRGTYQEAALPELGEGMMASAPRFSAINSLMVLPVACFRGKADHFNIEMCDVFNVFEMCIRDRSPPQCTGNFCAPTEAERANKTASSSPTVSLSTFHTSSL